MDQVRDFPGLLRLRLTPVLPLGSVNFVGGLARAPFVRYMAATAIGIIPSREIFTYFADSLVQGVGQWKAEAMRSVAISSVLLILLTLALHVVRRHSVATSGRTRP